MAKPRTNQKARRQLFEAQATELLLSLGAALEATNSNPWPQFTIDTMAGMLHISLHTDLWLCDKPYFQKGGVPWIAARFNDVARANQFTGIMGEHNRYSGKWNHHYWTNFSDPFIHGLDLFRNRLSAIVVKSSEEQPAAPRQKTEEMTPA
jgi:hypothetical protein